MFPYTWEDIRTIVELEDNRVIAFQKLEENRNRHAPAIGPVQSQVEYKASIEEAVDHIMLFLVDEEIFTVEDFLVPDDYFDMRDRANQLGGEFNLRDFLDEVLASGQIPWSLIRWEMTGYDDEVGQLW